MTNNTISLSRERLEQMLSRAEVFDDGSDGADAESARSLADMLRAALADPVVERQQICGKHSGDSCKSCGGTGTVFQLGFMSLDDGRDEPCLVCASPNVAALAEPVPPADQEECVHDFRMFSSECARCGEPYKAETVPTAGGEPEVVCWMDPRSPEMHATISAEVKAHNTKLGGTPVAAVNGYCVPLVRLDDHRAHVTRLQAEVERLNAICHNQQKEQSELIAAGNVVLDQREALQSELTKARELLVRAETWMPEESQVLTDIQEYLSHQSAPAAKDGE